MPLLPETVAVKVSCAPGSKLVVFAASAVIVRAGFTINETVMVAAS